VSLTDNLILVALALFLVLLNGFFVAAEFAIVKLRGTRVDELRALHGLRGQILYKVHSQLDAYLSACQLGITLASLGLGWVGEPAFADLLERLLKQIGWQWQPEVLHGFAFMVAFSVISYLHIVVGELAPKSAALRKPESISLWTALPLYGFYWLMYPFIWGLNFSANTLLRYFGVGTGGHEHDTPYSHEELRVIMRRSHAEKPQERSLEQVLVHTLELPQLQASDVMRPWFDAIRLFTDNSRSEIFDTLNRYRYSRYPLVDSESEQVLGLLHFKELMLEQQSGQNGEGLRAFVRPIPYFLHNLPVPELLQAFRQHHTHFGLVEDFDGRIMGFVTLEDVLESIFGEITDEHEAVRPPAPKREPQRESDGSHLVRGDTPLFLLERALGTDISESNEVSTVAGLVLKHLGHFPEVGEQLDLPCGQITVLEVQARRILLARVS
jgi:CBS domain containing-hemolysin-like protein